MGPAGIEAIGSSLQTASAANCTDRTTCEQTGHLREHGWHARFALGLARRHRTSSLAVVLHRDIQRNSSGKCRFPKPAVHHPERLLRRCASGLMMVITFVST